jgi:zinc protease
MRFAEDNNACTDYKSTYYYFEIPTQIDSKGIKRIPIKALEIVDDWTYAAIFNAKTVDEERPILNNPKLKYICTIR